MIKRGEHKGHGRQYAATRLDRIGQGQGTGTKPKNYGKKGFG